MCPVNTTPSVPVAPRVVYHDVVAAATRRDHDVVLTRLRPGEHHLTRQNELAADRPEDLVGNERAGLVVCPHHDERSGLLAATPLPPPLPSSLERVHRAQHRGCHPIRHVPRPAQPDVPRELDHGGARRVVAAHRNIHVGLGKLRGAVVRAGEDRVSGCCGHGVVFASLFIQGGPQPSFNGDYRHGS